MMRVRALLLTILVVAALALAACGGAAAPAAPAGDAAAPAEGATEATEAAPAEGDAAAAPAAGGCTDPLGCVTIAAGEPIKIAYAMVTSGPNGSLGIDSQRGMEIAVEDLGGEVLGHPIEIIGEDTGCSPEGGQAAAAKLASDASLFAVVGTTCSSEARVGAPIISDAGMSMISPSNTAPDLTDPAKRVPGYFRTAHNDKVQGRVAAEFVYNELGLTKAATIHDGSVYAQGLVNAFAENYKALGGEIVSEQAVNVGDTDMRPVLTTVAAAGPQAIYYPIFIAEGGFVTAQAQEVPGLEEVVLMGADGLFSPDFVNAAGDAAQGMYLSSPDFGAFGDAYGEFVAKYQEKYGEPPLSTYHAHAYDATSMIVAALQQVAQQDGDTVIIPKQALRDAIAATAGFQGLTGSLTCDPNGDCADPKIAVYEITDPAVWEPTVTSPIKVYPQ
jgi:branched-chain amino acid transport system substrate-binding protein